MQRKREQIILCFDGILLLFFPPDPTIFKHLPKGKNELHCPKDLKIALYWDTQTTNDHPRRNLTPNPTAQNQSKNYLKHTPSRDSHQSSRRKGSSSSSLHSIFQGETSLFWETPSIMQRGSQITPQVPSNFVTKKEITNKLPITLTKSIQI